mmetsp:Transcript_14055/g.31104  ORF Transcript_14055/g.31104 Transcript_14055/m.31104 type:complete len:117 (-) Transcript_14055:7-357(-)
MRSKVSQKCLQVVLLLVVICLDILLEPIASFQERHRDVAGIREESDFGDEMMFMQISTEDINSLESHCLSDGSLRRLLRCRSSSEVCARRTTLWTVAIFGFAFLQSGLQDVILLSI